MKSATITITEKDDDETLDIRVKFGPSGLDKDSSAHHLAARALQFLARQHDGDNEPDMRAVPRT